MLRLWFRTSSPIGVCELADDRVPRFGGTQVVGATAPFDAVVALGAEQPEAGAEFAREIVATEQSCHQ